MPEKQSTTSSTSQQDASFDRFPWIVLSGLMLTLLWGYWNSLREAAVYWEGAQYSHGFLVPLLTVWLLWLRRRRNADIFGENSQENLLLIIHLICVGLAGSLFWLLPKTLKITPVLHQVVCPLLFVAGLLALGVGSMIIWSSNKPTKPISPSQHLAGVGLLVFGLFARVLCMVFGLDIPDMYTFVPCMAGLLLLVGGWPLFRWAGPATIFLIFMFPLPWSVEQGLLAPLQVFATKVSTYSLQTLGVEAYNDGGNRIFIEELKFGVIDQCSGLRMTTIFLAFSVGFVLILDRPWWENVVILLSAIPIALTVNVIRITLTGLLFNLGENWGDLAHKMGHDGAGWLMMPLALVFLWLELFIMAKLFIEVDGDVPVPMWGRWR